VADYRQVIEELYGALNRHDGEAMARMYEPDGRFRDPAFGELSGAEAGDMWRMLTSRTEDLRVELREHSVDRNSGSARWIARYTFTNTGRPVVNEVEAAFLFSEDGLIEDHRDSFSFYHWARQALGPTGLALGWAPPMQAMFRRRARRGLAKFRREA
jgi:hypothetical protein